MLKINENQIISANLGGRGGKEAAALSLFANDLTRINHVLFDAIDPLGNKFEFKKQANLQWFDIGKYYNLTQEEKNIYMVFLVHKNGELEKVATIRLGKFIERLTSSPKHAEDGWTKKTIRFMHEIKKIHPRFQTKAPLKVKQFLSDNSDVVEVLYEKTT
tara:strand:- start:266 stop:745 length:480 start_codon:yes stop_codon:yes gene_type:complete